MPKCTHTLMMCLPNGAPASIPYCPDKIRQSRTTKTTKIEEGETIP